MILTWFLKVRREAAQKTLTWQNLGFSNSKSLRFSIPYPWLGWRGWSSILNYFFISTFHKIFKKLVWAIRFNLSIHISDLIFKKKLKKKKVNPGCFVPNNFEMNVAEYKKNSCVWQASDWKTIQGYHFTVS